MNVQKIAPNVSQQMYLVKIDTKLLLRKKEEENSDHPDYRHKNKKQRLPLHTTRSIKKRLVTKISTKN
jgi:hypothetical protein